MKLKPDLESPPPPSPQPCRHVKSFHAFSCFVFLPWERPAMVTLGGLLLGFGVGIIYGLVGLNAVVLIPALVFFFGMSQHRAQGTTIAMLLMPVGAFAFWRYWRAGDVDVRLALLLAAGFTAGAYLSSGWVHAVPDMVLRRGFAVVLMLVALRMFFQ